MTDMVTSKAVLTGLLDLDDGTQVTVTGVTAEPAANGQSRVEFRDLRVPRGRQVAAARARNEAAGTEFYRQIGFLSAERGDTLTVTFGLGDAWPLGQSPPPARPASRKAEPAVAERASAAGVHPSHDVELDYDFPDPHNPGWRCRTCREGTYSMCELDEDDEMRAPCIGYPWCESRQVTGDDGITRTVRKSGTGWA
jgi:hypothetical protein